MRPGRPGRRGFLVALGALLGGLVAQGLRACREALNRTQVVLDPKRQVALAHVTDELLRDSAVDMRHLFGEAEFTVGPVKFRHEDLVELRDRVESCERVTRTTWTLHPDIDPDEAEELLAEHGARLKRGQA